MTDRPVALIYAPIFVSSEIHDQGEKAMPSAEDRFNEVFFTWRGCRWRLELEAFLTHRGDVVGREAKGLLRRPDLKAALARAKRVREKVPADRVSGWDDVVAFLELPPRRRRSTAFGHGS